MRPIEVSDCEDYWNELSADSNFDVSSLPDDSLEESLLLPDVSPTIRKICSLSDLSRYVRYFDHLHHQHQLGGHLFTWDNYLSLMSFSLPRSDNFNCVQHQPLERRTKEYCNYNYPKCPHNSWASSNLSLDEVRDENENKVKCKASKGYFDKSFSPGDEMDISGLERTPMFSAKQRKSFQSLRDTAIKVSQKLRHTLSKMASLPQKCGSCGTPLQTTKYRAARAGTLTGKVLFSSRSSSFDGTFSSSDCDPDEVSVTTKQWLNRQNRIRRDRMAARKRGLDVEVMSGDSEDMKRRWDRLMLRRNAMDIL